MASPLRGDAGPPCVWALPGVGREVSHLVCEPEEVGGKGRGGVGEAVGGGSCRGLWGCRARVRSP